MLRTIFQGMDAATWGIINVTPWEGCFESAALKLSMDPAHPKIRIMSLGGEDHIVEYARKLVGTWLMKEPSLATCVGACASACVSYVGLTVDLLQLWFVGQRQRHGQVGIMEREA
jgi:hypothetical protein